MKKTTVVVAIAVIAAILAGCGPASRKINTDRYQVRAVAFSPDGKLVAAACTQGTIRLYSVSDGKLVDTYKGKGDFYTTIAFSPDGKFIASGTFNGLVELWDVSCGIRADKLHQPADSTPGWGGSLDSIESVAFSPDGKLLAASGRLDMKVPENYSGGRNPFHITKDFGGEGVKVWDMMTRQCVAVPQENEFNVTSLAFTPDGKYLAYSISSVVKFWNVATHETTETLKGDLDFFNAIAIRPDGKGIASGSGTYYKRGEDNEFHRIEGGTIRLWDINSGTCTAVLKGHKDEIKSLAYSPDGQRLASASSDKTARIWDVETGTCIHVLRGHSSEVTSVAFSPDGKLVASGSADGTVRIWQVE